MLYRTSDLKKYYSDYSDYKGKICRDIKENKLYPIIKGLYETNSNTSGLKLSGYIYGPSYVSFDYVLSLHNLIPEALYDTYTCATCNKRRIKQYNTDFGTYIYRDVPLVVFADEVEVIREDGYVYMIASPEKALCDKLYTISPVKNMNEFLELLFLDLRIDEDELEKLNKNVILDLAPKYKTKNLGYLYKYFRGI